MTQFIIKPDEDRNLYVMFNQDVPIAWGSKRDFIRWSKKARFQHFLNIRKDIQERLARADKQVTDNKLLKFDWKEDTRLGWRGIGTIRRSELKYIIELLDNGVDPDNEFIMVFVEPFETEPSVEEKLKASKYGPAYSDVGEN